MIASETSSSDWEILTLLLSTGLGRRNGNLDTLLADSTTSSRSTTVVAESTIGLGQRGRSQSGSTPSAVGVNTLLSSLCVVLMLHIKSKVGDALVV